MVGNGVLTNFYKQKISPDSSDKVHFVGDVSFEELPKYYSTAQIFCSPATDRESFGIVLIEAMASGTPIVAANNEGYSRVIRNNQNGVLVDPENPEALARGLARLINSKSERQKLAKQGKVDCMEYGWPAIVDRLETSYKNSCMGSDQSNNCSRQKLFTNVWRKFAFR